VADPAMFAGRARATASRRGRGPSRSHSQRTAPGPESTTGSAAARVPRGARPAAPRGIAPLDLAEALCAATFPVQCRWEAGVSVTEELEVLKTVTGRLDTAGIPYMITGSFAANYYAVPRMTRWAPPLPAGARST